MTAAKAASTHVTVPHKQLGTAPWRAGDPRNLCNLCDTGDTGDTGSIADIAETADTADTADNADIADTGSIDPTLCASHS